MASAVCETRGVGLSGAVASLVVVVPHVTRQGTGRFVCLGNDFSVRARRRRPGACCWLDQEPVRRLGRDSSQSCRAVSLHPDRRTPDPTSEAGGSNEMLADQVDYVVCRHAPRRACARGRCLSERCGGGAAVGASKRSRLRAGVAVRRARRRSHRDASRSAPAARSPTAGPPRRSHRQAHQPHQALHPRGHGSHAAASATAASPHSSSS